MLGLYDGNRMVVHGALAAGCRFFAGYPITPASSILEGMIRELPAAGGLGVEAEDEIASIGFCIGASLAGMKAMTATSGPGISLYSENLGLAIAAEVPLVIVDVQRQGPSTGSATAAAQGDVQFVRWATSGGLPIVALAPTTAAECYRLTVDAFNLAEELRCPVFLLTDKELALTKERIDLDGLEAPEVVDRTPAPDDQVETYRYGRPAEVPTMKLLDGAHLTRYTGSTHDDSAYLTTDPEKIGRYVEHLERKVRDRAADLERVAWDPVEGAAELVVSYGVTARSAREAVRAARAAGRRVSHLVIHSLWPVPEGALDRALDGVRRVIVPELNLGLYRREIERIVAGRADVLGIQRMDTRLISPEQILETIGLGPPDAREGSGP